MLLTSTQVWYMTFTLHDVFLQSEARHVALQPSNWLITFRTIPDIIFGSFAIYCLRMANSWVLLKYLTVVCRTWCSYVAPTTPPSLCQLCVGIVHWPQPSTTFLSSQVRSHGHWPSPSAELYKQVLWKLGVEKLRMSRQVRLSLESELRQMALHPVVNTLALKV